MNLKETLEKTREASRKLLSTSDERISEALMKLADLLEERASEILEANARDLEKMEKDDPVYDRVLLNEERIKEMVASVRVVAGYDSPIDIVLEQREIEKGMKLTKITTPIGVIGLIFEARPNVIVDVFALCFKSKNACVMKGGSQAVESYEAIIGIIDEVLEDCGLESVAILLPNDREIVTEMMQSDGLIDMIIPRGSQELIDYVRKNSSVPAIETGAGVVHVFVDESAELEMAANIVFNAKTTRPSVCNSMDTLLIHENRVNDVGKICDRLKEFEVEIFADERSYKVLKESYPAELLQKATEKNFGYEYLSLKMSVKVVSGIDEAISHINTYGSQHSEAIVTEDKANADKFLAEVDAAAVYLNATTRWTDGAVFGLGAEIGISTQKLHARGPMGVKELTSYKWIVRGNGQVR